MLTLNSFQIMTLISYFFWPLVRILAFFSMAPFFNDKLINRKTKIILASLISFLITPFLPEIHVSLFSSYGFILFLQQILIGIALGLTVQLIFATVIFSGEILGLQTGLSFATFLDFYTHIGVSITARLLNIFIFLFFLALNMHLYLISILINSFYSIPIDGHYLYVNMFMLLLKFSGSMFLNSIILIFPIISFLLALNIIMGAINRLSPQISIFSIGLSLNLLIGILLFYASIKFIFPFFQHLLNELISFITNVF